MSGKCEWSWWRLTSAELAACLQARVSLAGLVIVLLSTESAERVCLVVSFTLSLSSTSYTLHKTKVSPRRDNRLTILLNVCNNN